MNGLAACARQWHGISGCTVLYCTINGLDSQPAVGLGQGSRCPST